MKIDIQKVIIAVPFSEYAEGYKSAGNPILHIWVNIPRAMLQQRQELDNEYFRLMAELDIEQAEFRQKMSALDKQEKEEKRKPAAVEKERKRLVGDHQAHQDGLQARIDDYTTRNYTWFSEMWSQGPEDARWPVEDIRELESKDYMLLGWMADKSRQLLEIRRVDQKKG